MVDYTNSQISSVIDEHIHHAIHRQMLKDRLIDGMTYEQSGIDGDFASHKSTAICWRYQKAKGITKRGQHPLKGAVLLFIPKYQP